MGDRYFLMVECGNCGHIEDDVYYAPTCGFVEWTCSVCGEVTDLEKYTGITYEDASNRLMLEQLVKE